MSDFDEKSHQEVRRDGMDARSGERLATRGAYGSRPPNMQDLQRLDMIGAGVAALMILGPLLMGAIHA